MWGKLLFYRMVMEGLSDKVIFEQRPKRREKMIHLENSIPGGRNSKYKDPVAV